MMLKPALDQKGLRPQSNLYIVQITTYQLKPALDQKGLRLISLAFLLGIISGKWIG